jgi:hypothetical protein
MANESQTTNPARRWPPVVAIGLALLVARLVTWALEPILGYVGARGLSYLAAGATGLLVGVVICWLSKKTIEPR